MRYPTATATAYSEKGAQGEALARASSGGLTPSEASQNAMTALKVILPPHWKSIGVIITNNNPDEK
jgi:hypothetical protein